MLSAVLTLALGVSSMWAAAGASGHGLVTGFVDFRYQLQDTQQRQLWFDRSRDAGAGIVRLNVVWRAIEPTQPAQPTDPADRAYRFGHLDAVVQDAAARGFRIVLTVYNAPDWAEGANRPNGVNPGSWEPSPAAYGAFAQALATRYSGSYHARDGTLLPGVHAFEVWNEANQNGYLAPQWTAANKPNSPRLYRSLLNAFYAGAHKAQPGATVIGGAPSPYGDPPGGERMKPRTFLAGLFCLSGKLKPFKCGSKAHLDVLSDHPINQPGAGGPKKPPAVAGDISVANFGQVRRILHAAERAKHVVPAGSHHPIWATEFWWFSNPPYPYGVPPITQAKRIEQTLYLLWKQGASVALNYAVGDSAFNASTDPFEGSGLYFPDGRKKPSFHSFKFPFVTHRASHKRVVAWGKAPAAGKLKIQKSHGSGWRTLKKLQVHRGQIFTTRLGRKAGGHLRGRVGGVTSLAWHQR
jgi:hypothetical protein